MLAETAPITPTWFQRPVGAAGLELCSPSAKLAQSHRVCISMNQSLALLSPVDVGDEPLAQERESRDAANESRLHCRDGGKPINFHDTPTPPPTLEPGGISRGQCKHTKRSMDSP